MNQEQRKKILYIDIWTKGYRNFTRIDRSLKDNKYSTLLVHTGSFKGEKGEKERLIGDGLVCRDISYYNTHYIKKVIEKEKPDLILILNLSFIFDRAIVNICKPLGIKLVYLSHGKLISVGESNNEHSKLNKEIWKTPSRIFRISNFYFLINYVSSLTSRGNLFVSISSVLRKILKDPANFLTFAQYSDELDADLLLVYYDQDADLLADRGFAPEKIKVIGNPEISLFINNPIISKALFYPSIGLEAEADYVVYLDDGLVSATVLTKEEWYAHLSEILDVLRSQSFKLLIKLHPRTSLEDHLPFFEEKEIVALPDVDFKNLLFHAKYVISIYSSTIIYALILDKVVLIPIWGDKVSKLLKNYPEDVVKYCSSIKEFEINLGTALTQSCSHRIQSYLKENDMNSTINSINSINAEIDKLLSDKN